MEIASMAAGISTGLFERLTGRFGSIAANGDGQLSARSSPAGYAGM